MLKFLPVWLKVLGDHHSWLNDSGLFGEICFSKGLYDISFSRSSRIAHVGSYRRIMALTNLLTNQLLSPFLGL